MTDTSINLSGKIPKDLLENLRLVSDVANNLNIPILMVGATARDLVMEYTYGVHPKRGTTDIDFAVLVDSWDIYGSLKKALLDTKKLVYLPDTLNFRVISTETLIDIVPFGGLESPPGTIAFVPNGDPKMTTSGFLEAYNSAIDVTFGDDLVVKIVSMPALVMLKLVAWYDRPMDRDRDLQDLWTLLNEYHNLGNHERLFEEHLDLLNDTDFDYELAFARMLGRDVKMLFTDSTREVILKTLEEEDPEEGLFKMARVINRKERSLEDIEVKALAMLQSFKQGIVE